MKQKLFILLVAIGLLIPSFEVYAKHRLIPAEKFFKKSEKARFQLSRDGNYLSWLAPWKTRMNIFVKDLKTGKEKRLTSETERGIPGYYWISDEVIAFFLDKGGDENFKLYGVNINTGEEKCYTPFEKVRAYVVDDLEEIPDEILIAMNKRDKRVMDVYRLTLSTGKIKEVARNDGTIVGWVTDWNGKLRVAFSKMNNRDLILYRDSEKDEFKPLYLAPEGDKASPAAFDFDNKNLIIRTNVNRDKTAFVKLSPGGNELKTLFSHPEVDVGGLIISKHFKKIQGFGYVTEKLHHQIIDPELKKIINRLKLQNLGKTVSFQDSDKLQQKLLFYIGGDRDPGAYYLYEKATGKLKKLIDMMPWINKEVLSEMKPISYMSRDGKTKINGYLTLPVGYEHKNLPLIVNPHGGPAVRDNWGYNPEVQFLANRGYAVLQVNYRGSTGYGKKYQDLGIKQWGRGYMQHDLSDGVKWLINQGIADKDRVAIYGGSYGGYATLAGLTFTPELYACGVDYVGPSSLLTLLNSIPPYWEPLKRDLYRRVGHPEKDKEFLKSISPLFHVDNIKVPLFVVQGAKDPRVKKQEADQIVAAMKGKNIPVYYMLKENEGHGFHNQENQIEFYRYLEAFLAKHLGGRSRTSYSALKHLAK